MFSIDAKGPEDGVWRSHSRSLVSNHHDETETSLYVALNCSWCPASSNYQPKHTQQAYTHNAIDRTKKEANNLWERKTLIFVVTTWKREKKDRQCFFFVVFLSTSNCPPTPFCINSTEKMNETCAHQLKLIKLINKKWWWRRNKHTHTHIFY